MREVMTDQCEARLAIGGRIEGYKGRYAGLLEEPLLSLHAKKPLFLVGALGGCTRLVIDLLEGRDRPEMTTKVAQERVVYSDSSGAKTPYYNELVGLYKSHGGTIESREEIAAWLREQGAQGPASALKNGLNDSENRRLFVSTDPREVAGLVLEGLRRVRAACTNV